MTEVGLESELGWELGQSVTWVHFDPVISTATSVGWLEGAVEIWSVEGHQLAESVSDTSECAASSVDNTVRPAGLASFGFAVAHDLLRDFDNSVKDVADSASELARRGVLSSRRGLNVRVDRDSHSKCECDQ